MARPITWQNVNAPSNSDAVNLLRGAATGIDGAFDKFGSIIKEREAAQVNNQLALQNNAKNAYLDELGTLKTPEALAQREEFLSQMRANLDPATRAAVRGADEARLTSLRQQTLAGNEYADKTQQYASRPLVEQANLLAQNNDVEGLKTFLAENKDQIRDPAQFLSTLRSVGNTIQTQEFAANKDRREGLKTDQEIAESKAQIEQARINGLATAAAASQGAAGKDIEATIKAIELLGGKGGSGSGQGGDRAGNVDTLLKNLVPDEDTRAKMAGKIAPLMGNPLYKGLTDRELVSIAMQTKDQRGWWASTFGSGDGPASVESMADAIVKSPDYAARAAQGDAVEGMRRNLAQSLYAGVGGAPVPTTATPSLPTVPVPTEPAAKPTVSEAAAVIRGATPAPAPTKAPENPQKKQYENEMIEVGEGLRFKLSPEAAKYEKELKAEQSEKFKQDQQEYLKREKERALRESKALARAPASLMDSATARALEAKRLREQEAKKAK